jgi:hypothetical protein
MATSRVMRVCNPRGLCRKGDSPRWMLRIFDKRALNIAVIDEDLRMLPIAELYDDFIRCQRESPRFMESRKKA